MSDTGLGRKVNQHVEVCHSFRPATMLLHSEAGRQLDLGGCLEWHFVAMNVLESQIENYAAGDGLERTFSAINGGYYGSLLIVVLLMWKRMNEWEEEKEEEEEID